MLQKKTVAGLTATILLIGGFLCPVIMVLLFVGRSMWGAERFAGAYSRYANPHVPPFSILGWKKKQPEGESTMESAKKLTELGASEAWNLVKSLGI